MDMDRSIYEVMGGWNSLSKYILGHTVHLTIIAYIWKVLYEYYTQNSIVYEYDLLAQLQNIEKGNKPLAIYP